MRLPMPGTGLSKLSYALLLILIVYAALTGAG
ncbi:hypothetical protein FHS66_001779 [Pacificitalea manganoxidans]|nr:hypothetical protein [Pacificitalea manganoxidans]